MDKKLLMELGFSEKDAVAYRFLLVRGGLKPSQLQKLNGESRVNCYAILDRLVEAGLATKADENKKLTYYAESPMVIENILRNRIKESEQKLKDVQAHMPQLLSAFNEQKGAPKVRYFKGRTELVGMYQDQMKTTDRELYFVRSIADIAFFGRSQMLDIRYLAPTYGKQRFGLTPFFPAPGGPEADRRGNLRRTWMPQDDYRDPVEWVVTGDLVQAIVMKGEGYGVSIEHAEIAESLRNILKMLAKYIKKDPEYTVPSEFEATLIQTSAQVKSVARQTRKDGSSPLNSYLLTPIMSISQALGLKKAHDSYRTHLLNIDERNEEPLVKLSDYDIEGSSYYSRPNRLTGEPLAGVSKDVYIRRSVAEKLQRIDMFLKTDEGIIKKYGQPLRLHIDEGFRDVRVQNYVYDVAFPAYFKKHKPESSEAEMLEARERTLARGTKPGGDVDPLSPPPHYTGAAVDLNIQKADGTKLIFGQTALVSLGKQAFTDYYEQLKETHSVKDDEEARQNRRLLYWLMKEQGFENNPEEWWHYSIGDQMWARTGRHKEAYYSIPPNIPQVKLI